MILGSLSVAKAEFVYKQHNPNSFFIFNEVFSFTDISNYSIKSSVVSLLYDSMFV